eukprot:7764909-Alexandrium_andersonii.AAC.1
MAALDGAARDACRAGLQAPSSVFGVAMAAMFGQDEELGWPRSRPLGGPLGLELRLMCGDQRAHSACSGR